MNWIRLRRTDTHTLKRTSKHASTRSHWNTLSIGLRRSANGEASGRMRDKDERICVQIQCDHMIPLQQNVCIVFEIDLCSVLRLAIASKPLSKADGIGATVTGTAVLQHSPNDNGQSITVVCLWHTEPYRGFPVSGKDKEIEIKREKDTLQSLAINSCDEVSNIMLGNARTGKTAFRPWSWSSSLLVFHLQVFYSRTNLPTLFASI